MVMLEKAYSPAAILFFVPIIFIGAFFLLNLTLAVIKIKFTEEHQNKKEKGGSKKLRSKVKLDYEESDEELEQDALLLKTETKIRIQRL